MFRAKWESIVSAKVATGMPRSQALSQAAIENPQLRELVVQEANPSQHWPVATAMDLLRRDLGTDKLPRGAASTQAKTIGPISGQGTAKGRYDWLVAELRKNGHDFVSARAEIDRLEPGLREQVIAEANAKR